MNLDNVSNQVFVVALNEAKLKAHEFVTPEHFLYAALMFARGRDIIENGGGDVGMIRRDLDAFFNENIPTAENESPIQSFALVKLFENTMRHMESCGKDTVTLGDVIAAMFNLHESFASYILEKNGATRLNILKTISREADESQKNDAVGPDMALIGKYARNLTQLAKDGELDPLIGRADIIERTVQVLCRRQKNNPIHVGEPGVGKTAVVEGLARLTAEGNVPEGLKGANIYHIDMGLIVAGTKYRGDFEERFINVLDNISKTYKPVVYLDEIHNIVGAGAVSGSAMDAAGILKPYLSGGKVRFIGSTTYEDHRKYIEKNRALSRRFQTIDVPEPGAEECVQILAGLKDRYENHHDVAYPDDVIRRICELGEKYIRDRFMPDKAIDIMDETGACLRMNAPDGGRITVTAADIDLCVAKIARIPVENVAGSETDKLVNLASDLKKEIFGQDAAVDMVADAIKVSQLGFTDMEKPVANLLFVGPTGVGKTEIARQLAALLNVKLLRYDMSEYQEKHSVARLIGSPPGYVGYDDGGQLTEAVKKAPRSVLLLDEIEKAHPDIMNVLLQIMDYGALTDNVGKKADFRSVIIIMTSNAGAREIGRQTIGFDAKKIDMEAIDREVERIFSPEFRNRLDATVVFNHLDIRMARLIADKHIEKLQALAQKKNIDLTVTEAAAQFIAEKGLSEKYGAREIIRVINVELKKKLADAALSGGFNNAQDILADLTGNELILTCRNGVAV